MKGILTYHSVDNSGSVISVSPAQLERQLDALESAGVRPMSLSALLAAPPETHGVALTFDDGFENFAEAAAPVLSKRGISATVFVVPSLVGKGNDWENDDSRTTVPRLPLMTWDAIREVQAAGMDVGGHGLTHRSLQGVSRAILTDEVDGCVEVIEANSGTRPESFAFPYGDFDTLAVEHVANQCRIACTTRFKLLDSDDSPHALPRLEMFYFRGGAILKRWGTPAFKAYVDARQVVRGAGGLLRGMRAAPRR